MTDLYCTIHYNCVTCPKCGDDGMFHMQHIDDRYIYENTVMIVKKVQSYFCYMNCGTIEDPLMSSFYQQHVNLAHEDGTLLEIRWVE